MIVQCCQCLRIRKRFLFWTWWTDAHKKIIMESRESGGWTTWQRFKFLPINTIDYFKEDIKYKKKYIKAVTTNTNGDKIKSKIKVPTIPHIY